MSETVIDSLITEFGFRTDVGALRGLDGRIKKIQNRLNSASRGFAIAGGVLTGALFAVGRTIFSFETEMNRLRRDTGATAEEFAALRAQAIRLGSSAEYTTISVEDAARAQRELSKSGLNLEEVMEALPGVLNLVAATEIDVGEAATKSAKLIKAYGLDVSKLPRVHDLIAHSAVNAGITAAQLIDNLLRVGATSKSAGISIEDTVASLSLLVDQGHISERSATSFERTLVQLSKASVLDPKAQKAITDLGISIDDVEDTMAQGDIIGMFRKLSDAGLDLASASLIFGEDGARAALTLADSVSNLETFRAGLDEVEGSMKRQADIMNEGVPGAVNALKSAWQTAQVALGDAGLTGDLRSMVEVLKSGVAWFQGLDAETKRLIARALALGPVLLGVGAGLKIISFSLGGVIPLLKGFGALITLFSGPWGLAVAAAAALVYIHWKPLIGFFEDTWDGIKEIFSPMTEFFQGLWSAVAGDHPDNIFGWLGQAWDAAKMVIADPSGLREAFMESLGKLWEYISAIDFKGIGISILEDISEGLTQVGILFTNTDWMGVGRRIGGFILEGLIFIFRNLGRLFTVAKEAIAGIDWSSLGRWIGDAIQAGIVAVIQGIGGFISAVFSSSGDESINAYLGAFKNFGLYLWEVLKAAFQFAWGLLAGLFGEAGTMLLDAFMEGIKKHPIVGGVMGAWKWGKGLFPGDDDGGGGTSGLGTALAGAGDFNFPGDAPGIEPVLAAAGGNSSNQVNTRNTSINVDRIAINAEGGDPDLILNKLRSELVSVEQLHNVAEDLDSDVDR